ncbi:hypothetical protein EX30DRAFT_395621 [Ascodesmis nigricans]|uniref:Adipose-regulatory protein-domain-containing protein n=1 Tax=Ascodesmis nigricans TaxID=341454 RepID=A0A4S2MXP5_9PEZI|nr:hypothetical protein EX30DRAFT_395621 [Ascodesmis nigricans]
MQIPYTKTTVPIRSLTISTLLLSITSLLLFAISVIAYVTVYVVYVPQVVTTYPLQFTADLMTPEAGYPGAETPTNYLDHPSSLHGFRGPQHAISALTSTLTHLPGPALKPDQPYHLTLTLHLPPSPWNRGIGNFPVEVSLYTTPDPSSDSLLFRSHPAPLLPYRSPLTTNLRALLFSPLHLLDISHDKEEISVPLTPPTRPTITFPTAPESVKVRILGGVELYDAAIKIEAKLEGLRWWMYRYRLAVAVLAIGLFWSVGMMAAAMGWWIIGGIVRRRSPGIKAEPADKGKQVAVKQEPAPTTANENIERWITNPAATSTSSDIVKKEESDTERFQVPPYTGYDYSASEDTGSYGYEESVARYADDEETTETEETETEGEVKEEESDVGGYGGVGGSASGRYAGRGGGGGGGPVRRRVSGRGRGRGR